MPNEEKRSVRRRRTPRRDIEVLATLLVAYPEVSRVTFDPLRKTLSLVFLCRGPLGGKKRTDIQNKYRDSIEVYLSITGREASVIECKWEKMENFYAFQVERDVSSLSPGELNLTSDLVSETTKVVVGSDGAIRPEDDEFSWPPRVFLQEMLDQVRTLESPRKLVALREGEKVLVFDR